MMNEVFQHMKFDGQYLPFPVKPADLADAVRGLRALGIQGVNVTIPHKQTVFGMMHRVTEEARLAQAVNTVVFDEVTGELVGHNTDVGGWWDSIQSYGSARPLSVAVLGTGGAARAIATALALYAPKSELDLVARNQQSINAYITDFGQVLTIRPHVWATRHEVISRAELIINATPVGMWPNATESPVEEADCFHKGQVVQDIVYRPLQTKMMQQASLQGAICVDGLGMLVQQGARALQLWLSQPAPVDVMRSAAEAFLDSGSSKATEA
jgi:shikimate dehydrogenase